MEMELTRNLQGWRRRQWTELLARAGLDSTEPVECTALLWEDGQLAATGSRQGNVLKCIAVDPARQGEGLTAKILSVLRQEAFSCGLRHLFLYTKPQNEAMFSSLFFYPVAKTGQAILMEDRKDGVGTFLRGLERPCHTGVIGAAVMHCNPFTRGHRWLIERAAGECGWMYVIVLSEEQGQFPAADRLELVRRGTADLPNVTVAPTGPYLISRATFPTYFLRDKAQAGEVQCLLDIEVFTRYFVPYFGITCRYVGTEPLCPVTNCYNQVLAEQLPRAGVELRQLQRLENGENPVSASTVRALLGKGQPEALRALVPDTTYAYLQAHDLI